MLIGLHRESRIRIQKIRAVIAGIQGTMSHAQLAREANSEENPEDSSAGSAAVAVAVVARGRDLRNRLPLAQLPTMPQVLVCLLDLCHREEVAFGDIADIIRRDAGMSAKIMSVASSASQHGRARPASLDQCLTVLGMSAIKMIVINESILQVFRRFTRDRDYDLRRFWGHSLRSALIARELALVLAYGNADEAYLGGLLHDVGQLAMLAADADAYAPLFIKHDDYEVLCRHEQEVFGLTHAEVGAWLIEKWALDSLLSDSVLYHHDPIERLGGAHPLIRIVYLANRLAARPAQDIAEKGEERTTEDALHSAIAACGAANVDLPPLLEKVERELLVLAAQLGIELAPRVPVANEGVVTDAAAQLSANQQAGMDALMLRVRDVLLVDRVFGRVEVGGLEASLQAIAQAARLLFGLNPALCFLPRNAGGEHYVGHPIGSRWSKAALLEFTRGQSQAMVARAIDQGAVLYVPGERVPSLLDEQVTRLIGGAGLLIVPLRSQRQCHGVLVAAFASEAQAVAIRQRMLCLEHFAQMAGRLLGRARLATDAPEMPQKAVQGAQQQAGPGAQTGELGELNERLRQLMHEVSNPLAIIQNYLATLEIKFAEHAVGTRELGIVSAEITRVSKILESALQAPEDRLPAIRAVNPNRIIEDLVALCRASNFVAGSVDIQTRLVANPPDVQTDADRLKQLLLNLLKNAIEAVAGKPGIVRVATAPWGDGVVQTHLEIRVEDSGPGIPAEVLAQLYRPVHSSKGGSHRGVGLAVVGQLVRELHGLINCRSNERGTSFQLLLPLESA